MKVKTLFIFLLLITFSEAWASDDLESRKMNLDDVNSLIHQNRSIIIEHLHHQAISEKLQQQKNDRLPEILLGGDGYLHNRVPIGSGYSSDNSFLYHFNLASEIDIYAGGSHRTAIERMLKEQELSNENLRNVEQEVKLKAFITLYDIHRNIKYKDFINYSILLREKEYERIEELYKNGVVLKSDLLRSKLYITDLQKDEVEIENSIAILSDQLCVILGMKDRFAILPSLENDLEYKLEESFDELFNYALEHSPALNVHRKKAEREEIVLKEMKVDRRPHLKAYAQYGVGSAPATFDFKHQLGGEVGARLSFSISSFYQTRHQLKAQEHLVHQEYITCYDEEEKLKNNIYRIYTRYNESLLNIDRAKEKYEMSKETTRILTNSYFNQQALLIDVLHSETKTMEASFEWVEAVVDSQKYYWALKQICGYL